MSSRADFGRTLETRISRRQLLQALPMGAAGLALSGVGRRAQPAEAATTAALQPVRGGTLRVLQAGDIFLKDTPYRQTFAAWVPMDSVWDSLGRFPTDASEMQPWLAESWKFSPDYKSLSIRLREGVKFHSGRPMTVEDLKWSFETAVKPETGSQLRNALVWIQKMEISDKFTLTVYFDKPRPHFVNVLDYMYVTDRETWAAQARGEQAVGTGPFRLKEWVPGHRVTFTRNPDYWLKDRPYLDQIVLQIIGDPQTQLLQLQTGAADLATSIEARDAFSMRNDKNYAVLQMPVYGDVPMMGFTVTIKPFDDKRVRQAINYLIDRKRIVEKLFFFGEPIILPWDKTSPAYTPDLNTRYTYDPAKAKELLAQAGIGRDVSVKLTTSAAYFELQAMHEVIQAELVERLGWKVETVKLEPAAWAATLPARKFEGPFSNLVSYMAHSPVNLFNYAYPYRVPTMGNYQSKEYADLIESMNATADPTELKKLYRKMNELLLDECFELPIASAKRPLVATSKVHGFQWSRIGGYRFVNTWKEK